MLQLLFLLLPVAAVCGWYSGYRYQQAQKNNKFYITSNDYFIGLNYLIDEQPDKAVDFFIKMLEVDTDTIEVHLALGNLFRRRGEVDRAIRIHQNLIARPQLLHEQRLQALFELAQDYLSAGVLDRAERLFLELLTTGGNAIGSLKNLINIYQQQKDWQQAIATAKKLVKLGDLDINSAIAHYYCELAEKAILDGYNNKAHNFLQEAKKYDASCARINIILGNMFLADHDYQLAIKAFTAIHQQDADYVSEVIDLVADCYNKLNLEDEFIVYLTANIAKKPRIYFIIAMTDYIKKTQGYLAAIEYISDYIQQAFSMRGLYHLLDLYVGQTDLVNQNKLLILKNCISKLLENKPIYRCIHCGFASKKLYWHCPGCKCWNAVKPIHGPEGD